MATIFDLFATPSANVTIDGIGTNTGMSPANVDNVFRALAGLIRNSFAAALQSFFAGSASLPIAYGGTAAPDAPTALTNLGGLSSVYRGVPVIPKSEAFAIVDADGGSGYNYTGAAAALTLAPNSTTPITPGAVFMVRNAGSGALTITRGAAVNLYANGSVASADATLAIGGIATIKSWGVDTYTVSGSGLS